jgi:hypothetical protein
MEDTSNFNDYPDSESPIEEINEGEDPFIIW